MRVSGESVMSTPQRGIPSSQLNFSSHFPISDLDSPGPSQRLWQLEPVNRPEIYDATLENPSNAQAKRPASGTDDIILHIFTEVLAKMHEVTLLPALSATAIFSKHVPSSHFTLLPSQIQ
jgi:hypothetical protein